MRTTRRLRTALAAAMLVIAAPTSHAQTRRALLIGINEYDKAPPGAKTAATHTTSRGKVGPLSGAVNDARAMRDVLTGRYGFAAANVRLLLNADASRNGILSAIAALADSSKQGDIVLFFYAGHGSLRKNSGRPGPPEDQYDQTIVPVDANYGAVDIRDKELARALWPLAQKTTLTLIFDACHSGTITRGEPTSLRYRFAEADTDDVKDSIPAPPLDSVALHISSVQDYQGAPERPDEAGVDHGVFSAALVKVLASGAPNASAQQIYREVRAMVRSEANTNQEPVVDGPAWRREASLIDGGKSPVSGRVTVPVMRLLNDSDDSLVEIQGGVALGLGDSTELRPADTTSGLAHLTVVTGSGLDRSVARVNGATGKKPVPGTMYEVSSWGVGPAAQLKVWIPPAIPAAGLASALAQVQALRTTPGVQYVDDPLEAAPPGRSATLRWEREGWVLYDGVVLKGDSTSSRRSLAAASMKRRVVGATFTAAAVAKQLRASPSSSVRVRVSLPPLAEMRKGLNVGAGTPNDAIAVLPDPAGAQYLLVGRPFGSRDTVEYAFVLANAATGTSDSSGLPLRTAWFTGAGAGDSLTSRVLTLARIQQWLAIVPPAGGLDAVFPYHIAFRTETGVLLAPDTLARSDGFVTIELVLDSARLNGNPPSPWYVYVINIDGDGNGTSLCREGSAHVNGDSPTDWPRSIPRPDCRFKMKSPFGMQQFVLIASRDQLPTDALTWRGVRRAGERGGAGSGLAKLLRRTGSATRDVEFDIVVADWSVQRTAVLTMNARP